MTRGKRKLELLSPASNAETAIQAILHGADAVYIGPPSHGARKAASNSIEEIERVVDFAHRFRAKVYATVNTIIYDDEIRKVETLCRELYHVGVDALIVQDMGLLRMNLPPIALHASTQCDIRTPEKAKFLEEVGFSQLVLARELTLKEIQDITDTVKIPVETFVHGALCVSYSGRCHASFALNGRSANRGECAQICRYPYSLIDSDGKVMAEDKYLLSLKDFNATRNLPNLIEAGVSSFKIEGRLKEPGYVKNITALYNNQLNKIISEFPQQYCRSSFGQISLRFTPKADKSFNRGFTNYFLEKRKPLKIASLMTPKSQGELINDVRELNNGDGISFYDRHGNFTGVNVNKIEGTRIIPARKVEIPKNGKIFRTSDIKWEKIINSDTAIRKIGIEIELDNTGVSAKDDRGVAVRVPLPAEWDIAKNPMDYRSVFEKLGNTCYSLSNFRNNLNPNRFYRASEMTSLRRRLTELLDTANKSSYPFEYRRTENYEYKYPVDKLDYRDNVANRLSLEFYRQHGVTSIEKAAEAGKKLNNGDVVMTTRHCILRELGLCFKEKDICKDTLKIKATPGRKEKGKSDCFRFPLYLHYAGGRFRLNFDCRACEMQVQLSTS